MDLVDRLHARQRLHRGERVRLAAFARAVVEDDDTRLQRADQHRVVAGVGAVVLDLEHVDGPNAIHGTHEVALVLPREVPAVEETERAEAQPRHHAVAVVARVRTLRDRRAARRVLAAGRRTLEATVGPQHLELQRRGARLSQRERSGLDELPLLDRRRLVGLERRLALLAFGRPCEVALVQRADRHQLRELGHAAEVVHVEMREQQVVDALQPGDLGRDLVDAPRVAPAGIAGVDQHGLARGRDDERGRAALDVDPVDVEGLVRGACRRRGNGEAERQTGSEGFGSHVVPP
jgi:hypothetical protein